MSLAVGTGLAFSIALSRSIWVYRAFKGSLQDGVACCRRKGEIRLLHTVQVTERRFGPVHLGAGPCPNSPKGMNSGSLISDRPTSLETLDEYALRFDIEENFLDDKSAGFQLEASELRDADALARLCLVLAVATLYLTSPGTAIVAHAAAATWSMHTGERGLSYLPNRLALSCPEP